MLSNGSRKMINSSADSGQPCLTPLSVRIFFAQKTIYIQLFWSKVFRFDEQDLVEYSLSVEVTSETYG